MTDARLRGVWTALGLIVLLTVTASAGAQATAAAEAGATDPERAREAFVAGSAAIEEGRWADAVDLFRQAHDLSGSPVALFNLGYALRALGRFVEARDAFDRVLAGELDDASRAETLALRDEVAGRIARVELVGLDETMGDVRVDAREVGDAPPLVLELDPGPHTASVHAPGFEVWEWSGELEPGSRTTVTVELVPLPVATETGGTNVAEEPWLWIVIGVVVLAGAGVAIWAVDDAQQLRPEGPVLRL